MVRKVLVIVLPVLLIAGAIGIAYMLMFTPREFPQTEIETPSFLVGVDTAYRTPVQFEVHSQGTVSPRTSTSLISEVTGQVVEVSPNFVRGGFFKKGDVLIRIDDRNYQTAVKSARAGVARALTKVETENAMSGYALEDWEKLKSLNASVAAPSELQLRKPQLTEVLAELEFAEATLEKALEDLERTVIKAPYDGMLSEKRVDIGQFVSGGTQLGASFAVDFAEIRLPLALEDLKFIELPSHNSPNTVPVKLTTDVGGKTGEWHGEIVRTEGVVDTKTHVIHAVARIEDPYDLNNGGVNKLRLGSFVKATIEGVDGGELFVIPRHALYRGKTLWVVREDQTIEPREVDIVRSDEEYSYISNGIYSGEIYCVTPIDQPLPGMKVRFDG